MDAKSLVFKVQSDFSNASKELDTFLEKWSKLDSLGKDLGKQIGPALSAALAGVGSGSGPAIDVSKLLPTKLIEDEVSRLKGVVESLYKDISSFQSNASAATSSGGALFQQEIRSVESMKQSLTELYNSLNQVNPALEKMGTTGKIDPTQVKVFGDAIKAANQDIQSIEERMAGLQKNSGFRFFDAEGFKQDMAGVQQFSTLLSGLQEKINQVKGQPLAQLTDAKGIEQAQQAVNKLSESLLKLMEQYRKTGDAEAFQSGLAKLNQQASQTISTVGNLGTLGGLSDMFKDLSVQTLALALGFSGWFTVISTGKQLIQSFISDMISWEQQAAHLQAQTGATTQATNQMLDSIRALSGMTGAPTDQIAEGYRKASAEGFNFADSQKIVAAGLEASVAQGVNSKETISGLAVVLHNYNIEAGASTTVQALLYKASQQAGVGVDQLTQQTAKATGAQAGYKGSLQDVVAAEVAFVKSGQDVEGAGNQVGQMMLKLAQLSPQAADALASVNPNFLKDFSADSLSKPGGLIQALKDIQDASKVDPEIYKQIFSNIGGGGAALKVTADDVKNLIDSYNGLNNSGQNVSTMAADQERSVGTLANQWQIFKANMSGIADSLSAILIVIEPLTQKVNSLAFSFNQGLGGSVMIFKGLIDKNKDEIKQGLDDYKQSVESNLSGEMPQKMQQSLAKMGKDQQEVVKKFLADNGDELSSAMASGGASLQEKVAQAASTIAKGMEDSMKLLFEAKDFTMPEGSSDGILALAQGMKKIFDSFDVFFNGVNPIGADNQKKIADAAAAEIKALTDTAALFKTLPTVDISDPANKIGELARQLRLIQTYVTSALATSGQDTGQFAAAAAMAKNVGDEVKLLTDVANLFKELPQVSIDESFNDKIVGLVKGAAEIAKQVGAALNDLDKETKQSVTLAAPIAEATSKMVSVVKDTAGLYKDLQGVSVGDISGTVKQLVETAVEIQKQLEAKLGSDTSSADTAGQIAEAVGKMATGLKDVAGLYKEIDGVNFNVPDSVIANLRDKAQTILNDVKTLGGLDKDTADSLGNMAETVGREATMLKDVAGLYKEMEGVNFGTPDSTISFLAEKAKKIYDLVSPIGSLEKGTADGLSAMAEVIGREATALKDVAGLYKEMAGVDFGTPDSTVKFLADKAALIYSLVSPLGGLEKATADGLSAMAETIGREATALKDVAGLYKEMSDVDLGQPDEAIARLRDHAQTIFQDMQSLGQLDKGSADGLSQMAETVGKQASALKNTAELIKGIGQTDLSGDPTPAIRKLVDTAIKVTEMFNDYFSSGEAVTKDYSKQADSIAKLVSAVNTTAQMLKSLNEISEPNPSVIGKIKAVVEVTEEVSDYLSEYLDNYNPEHKDYSGLASGVSAEVKAVTDTVKMIGDLQNLAPINMGTLRNNLGKVVLVLKDAIDGFESAMAEEVHDPKLDDIAKDGEEIMKGLGETIKTIGDLAVAPSFNEQAIKGSLDQIIRVMQDTLKYFDQHLIEVAHGPEVSAVANDADAVMKAIDSTLKVFEALGSKKPMAIDTKSMAKAIDTAIGAFKYFIAAMDNSGVEMGAAEKAARFADDVGKVLDIIDKINKRAAMLSMSAPGGAGLGGISQTLSSLKQVTAAMQSAGKGGDTNAGVMAGIEAMNKLAPQIPPLSQQIPNLSNFNFNQLLGGSGPSPSGAPTLQQPAGASSGGQQSEPNHIFSSAVDKFGKAAEEFSQGKTTLNVDIVLDSKILGQSTNNEMFNNQTLRAQVVPPQQGV